MDLHQDNFPMVLFRIALKVVLIITSVLRLIILG